MNGEMMDNSKSMLGFWIYLMSDCILFGSLFATYAVLQTSTFGGPGAHQLFQLPNVLLETMILLTSSFSCGLTMLAARAGRRGLVLAGLTVTALLGATFLGLEFSEFGHLIAGGNGPASSGFLSAFFTLVGTHGGHIAVGLLWSLVLGVRIAGQGLTATTNRQLGLFSLFWHFLDIVWIFIFSIVYLMGVA